MLVASAAGIRGNYLPSLYFSSKHVILGFAKVIGECDPKAGVHIVCMCPDIVKTRLWQDREPQFVKSNRLLDQPAHKKHLSELFNTSILFIDASSVTGKTTLN